MKKNDKRQPKRLVLSRETVRGLCEAELQQVLGGTCYTDQRISQCCPAA